MPVAFPSRSAPGNEWAGGHRGQVIVKILPTFNQVSLDQAQYHPGHNHAIEVATEGQRRYSVINSDSAMNSQLTPGTVTGARKTEGRNTPLPGYTVESSGRNLQLMPSLSRVVSGHEYHGPPKRLTS